MDDLIEPLTEVYVEWFMEHLDLFLFVPPAGCVIELPFDMTEIMNRGEPTYGGKPMGKILPTAEEFSFVARLGFGLESMPGHESPVSA